MPSGAASNALLGSGGGEKRDSVNCQKSVCRISPLGASSSNSAGGGVSPASSSVIFVVLGVAFSLGQSGQGLGSVFGGGSLSSLDDC